MSHDTASETSRSTALVPVIPKIKLESYLFIRPTRPEDAKAIVRFVDASPHRKFEDDDFNFIVFNWNFEVVSLYVKREDAFIAREKTSFTLLWVQ